MGTHMEENRCNYQSERGRNGLSIFSGVTSTYFNEVKGDQRRSKGFCEGSKVVKSDPRK